MTDEGGVEDEVTTGDLVRSSAVVGIGTGLSRVTGLFRTVALTYAIGTTLVAEGYNLANTTPNIVYDLLLGGILSATLVPVFVDRFEHDDEDGVSAVVTITVAVLVAVTVVAVLAAPLIFKLYTWDKSAARAHDLERVGVPLLRWFLPQILFYGLTALGTALLNARRRFAAPAFAPVLNNIVVIVALLWFAQRAGRNPQADSVIHDGGRWRCSVRHDARIIAMTVVLCRRFGLRGCDCGGGSAFAILRCAASHRCRAGRSATWSPTRSRSRSRSPSRRAPQAEHPSTPTPSSSSNSPTGCSRVDHDDVSRPTLASAANQDDMPRFRDRFALGARLMTLVVLPASVGYVLLARPLVSALLAHGSFGGTSPVVTAEVLADFAVGLIGFSLYLYALRGFYAFHDTRTPFFLTSSRTQSTWRWPLRSSATTACREWPSRTRSRISSLRCWRCSSCAVGSAGWAAPN